MRDYSYEKNVLEKIACKFDDTKKFTAMNKQDIEMYEVSVGNHPAFTSWVKSQNNKTSREIIELVRELSIDIPVGVEFTEEDLYALLSDLT